MQKLPPNLRYAGHLSINFTFGSLSLYSSTIVGWATQMAQSLNATRAAAGGYASLRFIAFSSRLVEKFDPQPQMPHASWWEECPVKNVGIRITIYCLTYFPNNRICFVSSKLSLINCSRHCSASYHSDINGRLSWTSFPRLQSPSLSLSLIELNNNVPCRQKNISCAMAMRNSAVYSNAVGNW